MHKYLNLGKWSNHSRRSNDLFIKRDSFTLIEVLIFVSIMSIFFVFAASVVTLTLRNLKYNEHKVKALHYSRQLEDWLRMQKEIDWGGDRCTGDCCSTSCNFTQRVTQGDSLNSKFCFNSFPITDWPSANGCSGDYSLDSIFSREVQFSSTPTDGGYIEQVNATITVAWLELGQPKNITANTVFSVFESFPTPTP